MPLFKRERAQRSSTPDDVGVLLLQGRDAIAQTAKAHADRWGLGTADRWGLDQATGTLSWVFADKVVEAPAQFLGTYNAGGQSWRWAWANESLNAPLRAASNEVRRWGEANGQPMLTEPELKVAEEQAADLAAIAFRVSGATGFYRATAGRSIVFLSFGPVTIRPSSGDPEKFAITVE